MDRVLPNGSGAVLAQPVVSDGLVCVTTHDNRVSVLRYDTGALVWEKRRRHVGEFTITGQGGCLVLRDRVVVGFSDGVIATYDISDGATHWTRSLAGNKVEFVDVDTTPILADDHIIAGSYGAGLHAIARDGESLRWTLPGEGYGTPTLFEGMLYVPQAMGAVLALDAATGELLWRAKLDRANPNTPVVTRKWVVVPVGYGLLILDRGTGRVVERVLDTYGFSATPAFSDGTVYAQSNSGILYALGLY